MPKNSGKFHLHITLWEEEYRIFQKTFVISWAATNCFKVLSELFIVSKIVHRKEDYAKLRYDMEAEHTDLLYYSETHWRSRAKLFLISH